MIDLQQFYGNGLEKIRIANTKRGQQLLIKELFKFIMFFIVSLAKDQQTIIEQAGKMEKERDALMARNVCMILVATTVLLQFVLVAKFL